ncbi:MAG: GNAT family N-acetyltransferase [Flavobacteriales bacterium]|nr:GNAT family N-acetyltransferase [Flavobacteriales bacterium]MCB9198650.1 GNAT family N-acetyltransferase [Flavobacteriales bacterium]
MNIIISKVEEIDLYSLQDISKTTFVEAFSWYNTEENMNSYLENQLSYKNLLSEWENPNSRFYLLQVDNNIVGYLKLNLGEAQQELRNENSLEIERIYVLKSEYGKGLGQALLDYAFQIAKNKKLDLVWLGVWDKNDRARRFYEKNGFIEFGEHDFILGDDIQRDILLKKPIQ